MAISLAGMFLVAYRQVRGKFDESKWSVCIGLSRRCLGLGHLADRPVLPISGGLIAGMLVESSASEAGAFPIICL
jgi:hypothetical protein